MAGIRYGHAGFHVAGARKILMAVTLLSVVLTLGACAHAPVSSTFYSQHKQNLLRTLTNISASTRSREKADRKLLQFMPPDNPMRLTALMTVIQGYGQRPAMKIYAMDQLLAADKPLAVAVLAGQIPRFQHWRVLIHACHLSVDIGDQAMVDPLILSLDRPARRFTLAKRPESQAIRELTDRSVRNCLTRKLDCGHVLAVRLAALHLLYHLLRPEQFYALAVAHRKYSDSMLLAIRWYAHKFCYVPHTAPQVAWIEELHDGPLSTLARAAQSHVRWLPRAGQPRHATMRHKHFDHGGTPASMGASATDCGKVLHKEGIGPSCMPNGIPPCFMGLLAVLADPQAYPPSGELLHGVTRDYYAHRHIRRPGPYPGSPDNPDSSLAANVGKLSYCDYLTVRTIYAALQHSHFRSEVMNVGRKSRQNRQSEEGGLIALEASGGPMAAPESPTLHLKLYPSLRQINNGVYVTGPQLLLDTPTGLAQFVFHFQQTDNQRYAGPVRVGSIINRTVNATCVSCRNGCSYSCR